MADATSTVSSPSITSLSSFHPVILGASARAVGHTQTTVTTLFGDWPTVHLCEKNIHPYTYQTAGDEDDFLPLIRQLIVHDPWVIATPVYWYTMSGQLKIFWDRCTELLHHHRDLVMAMRGKTVILAVSSHGGLPEHFTAPIEQTLAYLKMHFGGCWDFRFPLTAHAEHNAASLASAQTYWASLQSVNT